MTTFGLHLTSYVGRDPAQSLGNHLAELGDTLESTDVFSTLWLTDHMRHPGPEGPTHPVLEANLALSAVAARTRRLRVGVLAASVVYRKPALLAKMITTLDALSGGRVILGIGAGHPRTEGEHREYGYDFPPVAERMALLEDALVLIRSMIGPAPIEGAPTCWPRPQPAGIPILVAGSGEQRLLRIAARHADMVNFSFPSGDTLERLPHKIDVLTRHCATVGRDPCDIAVTYKALLAVGTSRAEAEDVLDRWCTPRGISGASAERGVFVGEPSDIAPQVAPFLEAGVDHLVVELAGGADPKAVILAAESLAPLMGHRS